MKKGILILFSMFLPLALLNAQNNVPKEMPFPAITEDSLIFEIGAIPESLDENIDSLLHSWHVKYFTKTNEYCHDDIYNIDFPDSVYVERLSRLPSVIQLPYNSVVHDCITFYMARKRNLVRYILGMADFYFPIIEDVLEKHHLPLELKYLAVVESALNPVARSHAGASGTWQFMPSTGKIYGLNINSLIDERLDVVKATEAACKYFEDMYKVFGDWNLVMASYNCGPGNVNKAIRRSGGETDFWSIYPYLPRETRSYVPLFIAVNYIMNYYCDHNICPVQTSLPLATDTVMINKMMHFRQIADVMGVDIQQLRALNPQYRRDIIPGNTAPCVLKLPAALTYAFMDKEDSIYNYHSDELLGETLPASSIEDPEPARPVVQSVTHVVRRGETLAAIARHYGVSAQSIKSWNRLRSNHLSRGKRLKLHIYSNDTMVLASARTKQKRKEEAAEETKKTELAEENNAEVVPQTRVTSTTPRTSYKVRTGDTLYTISRKYPGISTDDLKRANDLQNANIHPGQILKIPVV